MRPTWLISLGFSCHITICLLTQYLITFLPLHITTKKSLVTDKNTRMEGFSCHITICLFTQCLITFLPLHITTKKSLVTVFPLDKNTRREAHWSFLLNEVNMIDALYLQMKDFASHTWAARCTSTRQSGFHAWKEAFLRLVFISWMMRLLQLGPSVGKFHPKCLLFIRTVLLNLDNLEFNFFVDFSDKFDFRAIWIRNYQKSDLPIRLRTAVLFRVTFKIKDQ